MGRRLRSRVGMSPIWPDLFRQLWPLCSSTICFNFSVVRSFWRWLVSHFILNQTFPCTFRAIILLELRQKEDSKIFLALSQPLPFPNSSIWPIRRFRCLLPSPSSNSLRLAQWNLDSPGRMTSHCSRCLCACKSRSKCHICPSWVP